LSLDFFIFKTRFILVIYRLEVRCEMCEEI